MTAHVGWPDWQQIATVFGLWVLVSLLFLLVLVALSMLIRGDGTGHEWNDAIAEHQRVVDSLTDPPRSPGRAR